MQLLGYASERKGCVFSSLLSASRNMGVGMDHPGHEDEGHIQEIIEQQERKKPWALDYFMKESHQTFT